MEKEICAGKCPFYTNVSDGMADGERKFKYRAILSGRSQIVGCLCNMNFVFARFCGYTRNEHGEADGAVFSCDLGHGYGFDDGEETITLRANETHRFLHSYTDTSDGTWDNDSVSVALTLIPFDEAECGWTAVKK